MTGREGKVIQDQKEHEINIERIMKDIKDYLHLYLFSKCVVTEISEKFKAHCGYTIGNETILGPILLTCVLDEALQVKLLLRPLSDMTEEEAAFIGELVYSKPDSVKWRVEHKGNYLNIYRKHYFKSITIDYASGDIDFYDEGELDTSLQQTEIFRYLLSMDFDLFGLIEAGLTIDKTKITV
jgi:hypothetical protein